MEIPFKNLFAALRKGKKPAQKRALLTRPYRDWGVLLLLFVITIGLFIAVSAYLFLKIRSGELITAAPDTSVSERTIDAEALREDLDLYRVQEKTYNALVDEAPDVHDPAR